MCKYSSLEKIISIFNAILLWGMLFVLSCCLYTKTTWGTVSLPQLLFFARSGLSEGVELKLMLEVIGWCFILPVVLTPLILFCLKKYNKEGVLFFNRIFFLAYLIALWFVINHFSALNTYEQYVFYVLLFVFYIINQWRSFSRLAVSITLILMMPIVWIIISVNGCERLLLSCFDFEETNFYEKEYVYSGEINIKEKRNVIVVFGESLEKSLLAPENEDEISLNDAEAVKFSNFEEGYAQRWTQGALFSAFTGTHIHYISDFFRYALFEKLRYNEKKDRILMISNYAGQDFDFKTPNIRYLGDVAAENGYQNLFVQGGNLSFSGTEQFLLEHGFDKENVYGITAFKGTKEYEKGKYWWGVNDKPVFELFKSKIGNLNREKPFLAVMFTLDFHRGENPFYKKDKDIRRETVKNINEFVAWFKEQDFYENTTLIILADHKRMGEKVEAGGGLYNAFFNLPERVKENLNIERTFNQIDVFPTILEIMGADLDKSGVGVSLFSKEKTIAERHSYEQQEDIFSKIDKFYQKIWLSEKLF